MNNQADTLRIQLFLESAKQLLSLGKYDFVPRRKNMQALAQYGFSIADVKSEILDLTVNDYFRGPRQDYDPNKSGDIWEFKKKIDGVVFYIKVKIIQENGECILRCLSFHRDGNF